MFVAWAVRRSHAAKAAAPLKPTTVQTKSPESVGLPVSLANILVPTSVVLMFAGLLAYATRPPVEPTLEIRLAHENEKEEKFSEAQVFNVHAFGRLPVVADGRVKPFDTLARNSLRVISGRETFKDHTGKSRPAIVWLLDVISSSEAAYHHKVFRIDNPEVQNTLGLPKRQGFLYSVKELLPKIGEFEKEVEKAREQEKKKGSGEFTVRHRKLLEVDARIKTFTKIGAAFRRPDLPPLPTEEDFNNDRSVAIRKMEQFRQSFAAFSRSLETAHAPLAVPIKPEGKKDYEWEPYSKAWVTGYIGASLLNQDPTPTLKTMDSILVNFAAGNGKKFNQSVRDYSDLLERLQVKELVTANTWLGNKIESRFGNVVGFESYFNQAALFFHADLFYVCAFVLAALAWLGFRRPLNSASFWLLVFTFTIHTAALAARIYISGRPPVTNLYSSAVFIGWGCVGFCLLIEVMYGMGIGNVIAAITGFGSLYIADILAADGDTFTVLQAVLDTQFWLATHVVCITFGYATTFLAGFLGIFYILRGVFTPSLTQEVSKDLNRMIYGIVCFSIFFSFFGTVLGGLWADDSWGRFWGWDPKENGALIIVLWNAVLLHARWGGMVEERGLAVLSVIGNIVTAWSWFGVNELGVGLHSYGFTEGRLFFLGVFVLSQVLFVAIGCLPRQVWWSANANETKPVSAKIA